MTDDELSRKYPIPPRPIKVLVGEKEFIYQDATHYVINDKGHLEITNNHRFSEVLLAGTYDVIAYFGRFDLVTYIDKANKNEK